MTARSYAKYYFELRSLAANEAFSIPPLDKDGAARIEVCLACLVCAISGMWEVGAKRSRSSSLTTMSQVSSTAETERLRQETPVPAGASPARARAQSVDYSTMVPQAAPLILS